ncbi:MAG TPA: RecQ family ATP-dependent DNA helicase, partial [Terriglobales bacterium]|nr:RecQ family ATP-dependent DNA helicase [Terriglobales bacterium]
MSHPNDADTGGGQANSSADGQGPGDGRRRRRRGRRGRRRRGRGGPPSSENSLRRDGQDLAGGEAEGAGEIFGDAQQPAHDSGGAPGDGKRRKRRRRKRRGRPSTPADLAAERLGIRELYREQQAIISNALAGRDVLVILPTGFGKSACYQVPSMVLPKPVVLISPLLALLRDQENKLVQRNIPSVRLDGTVRGNARKAAMARLAEGGSLLVMTTPETFASPELKEMLRTTGVSLVAVDEAHCISEWGHDFRPTYLRLGNEIAGLGERPPILALTATATAEVRSAVTRALDLRDPVIVASTPYRGNLAYSVETVEGDQRIRSLAKYIKRLQRPGIVYCATTRSVDNLYVALRRLRLPVHHYHGKMRAADREREQTMFMKGGRRTVMIATSAFGLGIDKPDIRYIIH